VVIARDVKPQENLMVLSDQALADRFDQLHDSLPDGGPYGWDWPTLKAVLPETHVLMSAIRDEAKRRLKVHGSFLGLKRL
jgi:hypothetical protein